MKSPTALAYLFGNPLSFLAILGATLLIGYESLAGHASGWLVIILIVASGFSLKCLNYLSSYGRWKREWDAMNDQPSKRSMLAGMSWLRYPVGIVAWIFGAVMALAAGNHPAEHWAGNVFWLVSFVGVVAIFFRAVKRVRNKIRHSERTAPVSVCPSVPLRSIHISETYSSLPGYCGKLFGQ
jgi:hypothetical protein